MQTTFAKLLGIIGVFVFMIATIGPASADQRDFYLVNRGTETIVSVYVSPHANQYWGDDVLGADTLDPGQYTHIVFGGVLTTCYYDIRVVYGDGAVRYANDYNLCSTTRVNSDY